MASQVAQDMARMGKASHFAQTISDFEKSKAKVVSFTDTICLTVQLLLDQNEDSL